MRVLLVAAAALLLSTAQGFAEEGKAKAYNYSAEDQKFFEEFNSLLQKHPQAASRFSLADFGQNARLPSTRSFPQDIWECTLENGMVRECHHPREQ